MIQERRPDATVNHIAFPACKKVFHHSHPGLYEWPAVMQGAGSSKIHRAVLGKEIGFSVRCLKDD